MAAQGIINMLNLVEILKAKGIFLENYKIHLATGINPTPLEAFHTGQFKEWQEAQNNRNFPCEHILALISLEGDRWLFAGVYEVCGVRRGTTSPYLYQTELLPSQDDLIGRVIIRYKRQYRASYIWGHKYGKYLEVAEIRPAAMSIEEFPGYDNAIVSHRVLKAIVDQQEQTWKSALSNVKGTYLIVDTSNGKMYVGSATADGGIWQRWESYVNTGHGGNDRLKELLQTNGIEYANNFQYVVLEIADSHSTRDFIVSRETYWKQALLSRQFGYNSN
jgi:hypothetical protein